MRMYIWSFISVVELHECRFVIILYLAILVHFVFLRFVWILPLRTLSHH